MSVANCPTSKDYHLTTVLCEANQRCASDRCSSSVFPEDRTVMHSRREQQPQRTRRSTVYREKRRDRHPQSQLHLNATSIEEGKAGWPSTSQRSCGERRDQETLQLQSQLHLNATSIWEVKASRPSTRPTERANGGNEAQHCGGFTAPPNRLSVFSTAFAVFCRR